MFEEVIVDQNPHWEGKTFDAGIPRQALRTIEEYMDARQIIAITGVRRCGKSTLLRQTINFLVNEKGVTPSNILFLNLENPFFTAYRDDVVNLEVLFADYQKLADPKGRIYLLLDELQYFKDWQVFVKSRYELSEDIKFIISGSNSRLLSSDLITLLSGRTLPLTLHPFSFSEYLHAKQMEHTHNKLEILRQRHKIRRFCEDYLFEGGFPEVVLTDNTRLKKELLANYAKNILFQDIVPRFKIKKPNLVEKLFFYLASNIASLFTYNRLGKTVGISDKTVKEYLSYFADAFLLFSVDSYAYSIRQQLRSPKKIYCIDNGMISSVAFGFSRNLGRYLENLIFLHFLRGQKHCFYYKTQNGREVDFLIADSSGPLALFQVSVSLQQPATRKREIRSLVEACNEIGQKQATLITVEEEEELSVDGINITIQPLWKFLLSSSSTI